MEVTRNLFRVRGDDETEPASWFVDGKEVGPTMIRLRSLSSEQSGIIIFCNKTEKEVMAVWINFQGHEVCKGNAL